MDIGTLCGEETLLFVQVLTRSGDDAFRVEHHDVLLPCADGHVELRTGDGGGTGTIDDDPDLGDVLADNLHRVLQTGGGDDGRAVLVVVHYGDVERTLQTVFDVEALRGLDVLQIDTAKGRRNALHGLAELLGILFVDFDVEHVDTTVYLEEQTLAFHDGLAAHGTNVAESQHRRAVRDDGHEVALVCVLVGVVGILLNL